MINAVDIQQIKELIEVVKSSGLSKIEISEGDFKIKMEMQNTASAINLSENHVTDSKPIIADTKQKNITVDINTFTLNSPIVGTVYLAPAKDMENFVAVGDIVKKGDKVCIVEAMKMLNEITAETDGIIAEVLVKNEDIVEFGQPMFLIKAL